MKELLVVWSIVLALAWIPLALKFQRAWRERKNPVSLAICLTMLLFTYANLVFMLAVTGQTSWRFYSIATRSFEVAAIVNFYVAFRWSDTRFGGSRKSDTKPPPMA